MILIIDNYDSFTYNLVQYVGELGQEVLVYRNDELTINDISLINPKKIIISPGPGRPENAGICLNIIKNFAHKIPILGVCLGHQAIGLAYGGKIIKTPKLMHGKTSSIFHDEKFLFKGLPKPLTVTRYHSLLIDKTTLPLELKVTAWTEEGLIMGCSHIKYPNLHGIQFHPESILTDSGKRIIFNFIVE